VNTQHVYFEPSKPVNRPNRGGHGQNNGFKDLRMDRRHPFPYQIMEGLPVIGPQRDPGHLV
jgi:hypothetical protein